MSCQHGLLVLQPLPSLYETYQLTIASGLGQGEPEAPFLVLVANLGTSANNLVKNQLIRSPTPHWLAIVPTKVMATDVLGIVTSEKDVKPTEERYGTTVAMAKPHDYFDLAFDKGNHAWTIYDRIDWIKALQEFDLVMYRARTVGA